ncbi:MAG: hypothetical protein RL577_820 [Bacteroidota bacterium]|jgi:ADP-L-glycero-D-manno-heptose 6-epimerase
MIVVTGAAGFIGSALLAELARLGYGELVAVDDFSSTEKRRNWEHLPLKETVERLQFHSWLAQKGREVQFVFHLGARTKTNEFDETVLEDLNWGYSQEVWKLCVQHSIPLVYASSAATYGDGKKGFDDDEQKLPTLEPMNPYGRSKQKFDLWVLDQVQRGNCPPYWAGFKFFNVFGPGEYHKGRMASVVFHGFHQVISQGYISLFKSYKEGCADGQQQRDFVSIFDVLKVLIQAMENRQNSGIYNLGTGKARSFLDLALAVFSALDKEPDIRFIDMPEDIRGNYQYFTQADTGRLIEAGYIQAFSALEDDVAHYVQRYLRANKTLECG